MNYQTKILLSILFIAVVVSTFITFHQTVILKNFEVVEG